MVLAVNLNIRVTHALVYYSPLNYPTPSWLRLLLLDQNRKDPYQTELNTAPKILGASYRGE